MKKILIFIIVAVIVVVGGSILWEGKSPAGPSGGGEVIKDDFPKIASWCAKKDEIIQSKKPFDMVITGWVTPEEAKSMKENNPNMLIVAGLTTNWVWANAGWMQHYTTVANYGKSSPIEITEDMYLYDKDGKKCAFGWESEEWQQEEIYAMDPTNEQWIELVLSYYKTVLEQPQHDGITVDMVTQWSPCKEGISDAEWIAATKKIFQKIKALNKDDKLIIINAGKDLSEISSYQDFFDGYLMENFMGDFIKATYKEGLENADKGYIVVYGIDTDNTGKKDKDKMRLGLTLSLLNDNTYFTYDFGPRDHGQAWWFDEYDADLGKPLGDYYKKDNAYFRDFEKGTVVSSPYSSVSVSFDTEHQDITTKTKSTSFTIGKGDGRIFIKP